MRNSNWWLRLVGPAIAILLFSRIDLSDVVSTLAAVRWVPVTVSLVLVAPFFVVKGWRWRLLLDAYGRPIRLLEAVELYTIAAGAGAFTPGAIGDFSKGLAPTVGGRAVGLWTSALDRLYDVAILVLLGLAAAAAWLHDPGSEAALALSVAGGSAIAWALRARVVRLIALVLPSFPQDTTAIDRTALPAAAATVVATGIAFVRFALLVAALGLPLDGFDTFVCFVLTSGVAALPLSIAGLGTRDALLLGYLRAHGVAPANAIALSSLCLLLFLWNGIIAALLWLFRPPRSP
jgi:glycosyltransferase 2 family protein